MQLTGPSAQCTNCYTVEVTAASRPATHWDPTVDEAAGAGAKTWTLHVGESFADVPDTHLFYSHRDDLPQRRHGGLRRAGLLPGQPGAAQADGGLSLDVAVRRGLRATACRRHLHRRATPGAPVGGPFVS
jgi:hypothetical protein